MTTPIYRVCAANELFPGFLHLSVVRVQPQTRVHRLCQLTQAIVAGMALAQQTQKQGAGMDRRIGYRMFEVPYGAPFPKSER